ncbi:hypothetical protein TIFTF001_021232 [Ficus carica]|uniref:Uncharacterized protein n=1 Tax=Ficus carica TaxID=3494 RepID=A0AA88AYQ1_FICCA|nr:hypothetical protein TIFTF001_021232 [Ficus carica]
MGSSPAPFSEIGKKAKDLLTKDYNFDQKFSLSVVGATGLDLGLPILVSDDLSINDTEQFAGDNPNNPILPQHSIPNTSAEVTVKENMVQRLLSYNEHTIRGKGLIATGLKRDQIFIGDLSTIYKSGNTTVDVKVDTYSNVTSKVTVSNLLPSTKAALSFKIPDNKSGKVSTTIVTVSNFLPSTKAVLSFKIPDNKSGKLDVQYLHPHAAFDSSIGLNPNPLLELSATIGSKELSLGGEVAFDTASASFIKYNAGISLNKHDYSAALLLTDKGQALKASYIHYVDSKNGTTVAAELIHRFSSYQNNFSIGSSHAIDPFTIVKTRLSDNGKIATLLQREWRPKSLITFSAEYDSKAVNATPKLGLALTLKP